MGAFLSQTELSRGGLKLFLSNDFGQPQDAAAVRWTVFSAAGEQASGAGLPAVKSTVGEYYAPWFTDVSGGSYRIEWEIQEHGCGPARVFSQYFFVASPEMYTPCGVSQNVQVGKGTFKVGQQLGPCDLTLYLKNDAGFLQDAYAVFWTIVNSQGCPVTPRSFAGNDGVGSYFAPWLVMVEGGDYSVKWEFQQDADSPLQQVTQDFYVFSQAPCFCIVLSPMCCEPNPQSCTESVQKRASPVFIVPCGSGFVEQDPGFFACGSARSCAPCLPPAPVPPPVMPSPPSSSCCAYEIPRVVHIQTGVLPANGAYTSQPQYPVPNGIRHITFYITYTRGAPQGFAAFKLLWGNGTEEHQETVIDTEVQDDSLTAAQSMFLQRLEGPVPVDGLPVSFVLYVTVPGGSNRVRLLAAEKGMPGLPGTLGVALTAST